MVEEGCHLHVVAILLAKHLYFCVCFGGTGNAIAGVGDTCMHD